MKPWDKLRGQPDKLPMAPGMFHCINGVLKVTLHRIDDREAEIAIGADSNSDFGVQADTARVLSEFFLDVAEQLEAA